MSGPTLNHSLNLLTCRPALYHDILGLTLLSLDTALMVSRLIHLKRDLGS